ncbi:hypothetical protein H0H87_006126 [Tephrocybe sp. NHM501043]|nr:hypothetical protein H0H87_006126 [Tephrocybe sp. NHM501043]
MPGTVFSLPIPLILLIHLHVLEYPHANKPEYDHNMFEPSVRGLKERTKLLEDVGYFLVGRLEGSARTILATYPCAAPSDTLAFRTSLSKYLETLRHGSVFPLSNATAGGSGGKGKGKESVKSPNVVAWWWKDVVVRKSLLEECAGERFERLLLSISTHALLKGSAKISARIDLDNLNAILRSQPSAYADLLKKCKLARQAWAQSASALLQREVDLRALRARLGREKAPQVSPLSTESFILLVESKREHILRVSWPGSDGKEALELLEKAAGIERPTVSQTIADHTPIPDIQLMPNNRQHASASPQPLPIAAAHHPAYLKKIRKPVFTSDLRSQFTTNIETTVASKPIPSSRAALELRDKYEAEGRMQRTLTEVLTRIKKMGKDLAERMKALEKKRQAKPATTKKNAALVLDFWEPEVSVPVDFETEPTPELLASFSLNIDEQGGLEARIDEIRDTLLPAYPPLPDLTIPRLPHAGPEPKVSKIPRAGTGLQKGSGPAVRVLSSPPPGKLARADKESKHFVNTTKALQPKKAKADEKEEAQMKPKSTSRKSFRASLAMHAQRRPSLFAPPQPSDTEEFEDDVHQIIHSVQDTSAEIEVDTNSRSLYAMTSNPNSHLNTPRTVKVNRIFTVDSKTLGGSAVRPPPKQSFPGVFLEPTVPLPSLVTGDALLGAGRCGSDDVDGDTDTVGWGDGEREEEGYEGEEGSMTLKEILLSVHTTEFALLGEGGDVDDIADESFNWE